MIPRILEIGKRVLTKKGLPAHIVLFITNKCNMECEHCFLVEGGELNDISRQQVLTLDNIKKIANSNPKILALSRGMIYRRLFKPLPDQVILKVLA